VLEAGRRGFDLVIVDLPRHLDAAAIEALGRAATTLLVATADVRGVLSAAQVLRQVPEHTSDIPPVIRPGVIDPDTPAASLAIPAVARLPDQPRLTATLNRGELPKLGPRTTLGTLCTTLLHNVLPT